MAMLLFLADGFEEIEALGTLDLLRRAQIEVQTCAMGQSLEVRGAHELAVMADGLAKDAPDEENVDGVILPGGMGGAAALAESALVRKWIQRMDEMGRWVCAICAAPALVLPRAGVLRERMATCYPAPELTAALGRNYVYRAGVVSENLITAAGPGCFGAFARAIVKCVRGEQVAHEVFSAALMEG